MFRLTNIIARPCSHTTRLSSSLNLPYSSFRYMTVRAKRGGKNDEAPAPVVGGTYCLSCGRLMPSPTCKSTLISRLILTSTAGSIEAGMESIRIIADRIANQTESTTPRKYCSASCRSRAKDPSLRTYHTQLAQAYYDRLSRGPTDRHVVTCSEVEKAVGPPAGKQDGREEARRTARRLVNFGFKSQGIEEDRSVEAVQDNKVVETSFAKGEWGIRWQSR